MMLILEFSPPNNPKFNRAEAAKGGVLTYSDDAHTNAKTLRDQNLPLGQGWLRQACHSQSRAVPCLTKSQGPRRKAGSSHGNHREGSRKQSKEHRQPLSGPSSGCAEGGVRRQGPSNLGCSTWGSEQRVFQNRGGPSPGPSPSLCT